jgi:hypothetical protein
MYRYRPRAPARGKGKNSMQGMSDSILVSEGGPLERTIKEDLLALQATFFEILEDELSQINEVCKKVLDAGRAFSCFKAAFRVHNFATIYNYCPVRCDLDSFSQLLYSVCLGLLVDAMKQPMKALYAKHAAFAVFSLYGLYKISPYPFPLTNEKHLSMMPFGSFKMGRRATNANVEDKSRPRRTYKSPIHMDKHIFLILQQLRDFCLATLDQCDDFRLLLADGSTLSKTAELPNVIHNFQRNFVLEYDILNVINKIQREGLIELSETFGPGTVEDLAGSRQFTGKAKATYDGIIISPHHINEFMVMNKSRITFNLSNHVSSLQDAAKLYISSLSRMKPFDHGLSRGKTHQVLLLSDTLKRLLTIRDSTSINVYINQIHHVTCHLIEDPRPNILLCNADPAVLRNKSDQLPSTSIVEQACTENFGSNRTEPLVGRVSDDIEESSEQALITNIYKILLPKTMPLDVGKNIENALFGTEWDVIIREYEERIGKEANEVDELSERSLMDSPNFQKFLCSNSEDLESGPESSIGLLERDFDESSVIPRVGEMALNSLLTMAAHMSESSSSTPDTLSESSVVGSSENREQNDIKISRRDASSMRPHSKILIDADQVSKEGSTMSDIGKQAIDTLIEATIISRKLYYQRSLNSKVASNSSVENAKRKRKRIFWQPSEKQNPAGSQPDTDQVSSDGSIVSDIGKQAIDSLIDATIKSKKLNCQSILRSEVDSNSSIENAKHKRKRIFWQPSEKQNPTVSQPDADQVSNDGSIVSGIGKQIIDTLIDATIKSRKHNYQSLFCSKVASNSSFENAKGKRKRILSQPSEKHNPSGSQPDADQVSSDGSTVSDIGKQAIDTLIDATIKSRNHQRLLCSRVASKSSFEDAKQSIGSGDIISNPLCTEQDETSTFSGIGMNALKYLLSDAVTRTKSVTLK